jgi:amino acid transporter
VVLTGSVGSMAFAFADYAQVFWALPPQITPAVAVASILAITGTNLLGLRAGTIAQNLLTAGKLVGLGAIIALSAGGQRWGDLRAQAPAQPYDPGLALVFILYAYAGWTHAAYVAAEVDRPRQTLPRALLAGVGSVMALYLAVNLAFVAILGFQAARDSHTPAADAVLLTAGPAAAGLVSLLVMLSALGAINGTILTGAHVLRELGRDEPRLAWLGGSTNVAGTPVRGLLAEAAVALLLVLAVGTASGRRALDGVLAALWLPEIPWEAYHGGFETLVAAAAPLFWLFLLLTGASLFVLRRRDPTRARPFRAPLYPWTPLLFCAACGYMLWMSVAYARGLCLVALAPIVSAGLISATRPR